MRRLLLIVVAFILYGSLYPFQFDSHRAEANPLWILLHAWPAHIDRFMWRDACVNLLLYCPFGLAAVLVLGRRLPRAAAALVTLLLSVALSASIEMLQVFDASRTTSLLDVVCNLTGGATGVAAALVFEQQIQNITRRRSASHSAAGGLLLACCWAAWQLYPFMPVLGRGRLRVNIARFLASPFSLVEVYACAAEWFAFALVLQALRSEPRAPRSGLVSRGFPSSNLALLLAMGCLPLRLLIVERTLAPAELLGAALALLIWTYPAEGPRLRPGAAMLAVAIVLRELSPFAFSAPPHPMLWIPFSATLDAERLGAALVIMRKAFEYGTLVWLLRTAGLRYWLAGTSVSAGLLALESAQRYLPNRQPELTDAVLAALLTCILASSQTLRRTRTARVAR